MKHHLDLEGTAEPRPPLILYGSPLACSGAAHLVLLELGLPHEVVHVDIYAQPHVVMTSGALYSEINPKNAVPALRLATGELLTEVGVILQYLADSKPESGLLPSAGTLARYRALEWLSFVGSDVHKTIGPLFHPECPRPRRRCTARTSNVA
jgi:glutathione S-transferase